MSIPSLSPTTTGAILAASDPTRSTTKILGQDDFLKLLVTEMTSQDPLSPKDDKDFFAEMAQFSSLEQSRSIDTEISQMRADQKLVQANGLLGRTVQIQADEKTKIAGVVETVEIAAGTPKIIVGGQSYDLDQLLSIAPTPADIA